MNTPTNTLGCIFASTCWADGTFDESERAAISEIAEALDIPVKELEMNVTAAFVEIKDFDEPKATEFAIKHCNKVDKSEGREIYQAIMHLATCNGEISDEEVNNMLALAEAVGVGEQEGKNMLKDFIEEERKRHEDDPQYPELIVSLKVEQF